MTRPRRPEIPGARQRRDRPVHIVRRQMVCPFRHAVPRRLPVQRLDVFTSIGIGQEDGLRTLGRPREVAPQAAATTTRESVAIPIAAVRPYPPVNN